MKKTQNKARAIAKSARFDSRPFLIWTGLLLVLLALSACGGDRNRDRLTFDDQVFRSKLSSERDNRQQFEVTVRPASLSLIGAREAGRYEATGYCIDRYGTSNVDWALGPDVEDSELSISDDTLTLQGTCAP